MAVGTAFIQVIPDLTGFHRKARRDLSNDKLTAPVDLMPEVDARAARRQTQQAARNVGRVSVTMTPEIDAGRAQSQATSAASRLQRSVPFQVDVHQGAASRHADTMAAGLRRNVPFAVDLQTMSAAAEATGTAMRLRREVPFDVDLDTGTARMQATAAATSMRRTVTFNVDIDRNMLAGAVGAVGAGSAQMASSGFMVGNSFARVALIVALLGPLIVALVGIAAAGIMAIPALVGAIAVPIAAIVLGFEGIKRAAASVAPAFAPIKAAVSETFYQVMLPVFQALTALVPILQAGLVGTAHALGGMAMAITNVLTSAQGMAWLQQIFAGVNMLITGMTPVMATLTAAFMQLAAVGIGPLATGLVAAVGQFAILFQQMIQQTAASGLLQAAITLFTQTLGVLLAILPPLLHAGMQMFLIFGPTMIQAFQALIPVLGPLLGLFGVLTQVFFALFAALLPVIGALAHALTPVVAALVPIIAWLGTILGATLVPLLNFLAPALQALAPIIAVLLVAWGAWAAANWVLSTSLWSTTAALLALPITWVVIALVALVAAVIYAWQNFEWFRVIVTGAWNGIVVAAQWAWSVLQTIFAAIWTGIQAVGGFFVWLWQAAVVPAWNGITAAMGWAWHTIMAPILNAIGTGLRFLGAIIFTVLVTPFVIAWNLISAAVSAAWNYVIRPTWDAMAAGLNWLWNTVIAPVCRAISAAWSAMAGAIADVFRAVVRTTWDAMAAAANWLWNTVLRRVFDAISAGWNAMVSFIAAVWNRVLRPTWDAVASVADWLWNTVLRAVFSAIGAAWNGLLTGMRAVWDTVLRPCWEALATVANWLWNSVLRPVFGAIGAAWAATLHGIRAVYDRVLVPTFDAMKAAVHAVGAAFASAVRWIGDVWNTIRGLLARPVNFMINVVYNRGVKAAWDRVAGWLKLPPLPGMAPIPEFAKGGLVPGRGNKDTTPAWLTPGEYVLSKPAVDSLGGAAAAQAAHRNALTHPSQPGPGMGAGPGGGGSGHTWTELKKIGEDLGGRFTSGLRPGDSGYHGKGQAVDLVSGNMVGLAESIFRKFPHATQIIHSPWRGGTNVLNGRSHRYTDLGTYAGHFDHVHWAMTPAALGGATGIGGDGAMLTIPNPIAEMLHGLKHGISNPIRGGIGWGIDNLLPGGEEPGTWKSGAKGFTFKIFDSVVDWVDRKIDELFPGIQVAAGGGGGDVEQWRPVALRALQMTGQPLSMVDALLRRMQQESGGNPRAINLWDSNAKKGTPSMGLMQTIMPTFQAHKMPGHDDIWNPLDNILASIRYTLSRYGSLPAGYNRAGGYDSGGWLPPGLSLAYNGTGKPEAVLTSDQFDAIERYANSGSGTTINVATQMTDASPQRIAASIDRHLSTYGRI